MRAALIVNNYVHQIFEDEAIQALAPCFRDNKTGLPKFPSYPDGSSPFIIDITAMDNIKEQDRYIPETREFKIRPTIAPDPQYWKSYLSNVYWDEDTFEYKHEYKSAVLRAIDNALYQISQRDYRALKAIKLGVDIEDIYPGEREWYLNAITYYKDVVEDYEELTGETYVPVDKVINEEDLIGETMETPRVTFGS